MLLERGNFDQIFEQFNRELAVLNASEKARTALLELNRLEDLASKHRPTNGTPRPMYTWTLKAVAAAATRYRLAVRELNEARSKR